MEVSSVSSNSFAPAPQVNAQPKQAERTEQTQQKPRPQEAEAVRNDEPKRPPVVNTQGQTTGRIINTSA